ncbi:hypothetical protein BCR44DRAFT_1514668 [Catenaria anguillulae PL171]|uniref:t-SNARE coiled-coil homology domain-containing protein n=1 Tax=Catenaria anguillulae PL171 TaxID=765915 RepID=A0A1Y2HK69_9FUNG|nr:hypothetical protein BCR44DRAFT_1514668 [Catenaria anguillulae PL171]
MNKSTSFSNPVPTAPAAQSLLRGSSSSLASGSGAAPVPVATTAGPLGPPAASTPPSFQPAGPLATTTAAATALSTTAGADSVPSFSTAGNQWKSDLANLTSLADSTLLLAMDVSHIPTHLASASPNVSKFLANLATISQWLQAAEQALSRAEESLAMSAPDLKAWEDQVVKVSGLVDEMRVVASEYSGEQQEEQRHQSATEPAALSTVAATAAQERAQLLGLSTSTDIPGARIARVSLATRRGLNTSTHPNHRGHPADDSPDNDPTNPYEHLHPQQLVQVQQLLLDDQDSQLDALANIVGRQKHVAIEMHDELEDQVGLLDEMDGQAERVGSRLRVERRRVEEVGGR